MLLPIIELKNKINKDSFYFGCDSIYFNLYGISLVNSLRIHAPWAHIHVHLFNPKNNDIEWCDRHNVTVSYESVDISIPQINTYYACVRFIRIPQIFEKSARIISIDCDGIAISPISQKKFIADTEVSKVLWREKQQQSLASSVFFGPDDFRVRYADKLKPAFEQDNFKWFHDQNIMDDMIRNNEVEITSMFDWGSPRRKIGVLIWTGKGDRKNATEFQEMILEYKNGHP